MCACTHHKGAVGVVGGGAKCGACEHTPYGDTQLPIQTKTPTKMNIRISTTVATMPPMRASDMGFFGGFSGGWGEVMGVGPLGLGCGGGSGGGGVGVWGAQ